MTHDNTGRRELCRGSRYAPIVLVAGLATALPVLSVADQPPGGAVVSGSVKLTAARPVPLAASVYARRGVAPKQSIATPEIRNVVVYLAGVRPGLTPAPLRSRVAQRNEQFVPQVTAITVGSSVEFPNEDPFFHNVFSLSRAATFDLGR